MGISKKQPSVFVSYCWKDKDVVDSLDNDFQSIGLNLIRDIRDVDYRQNIKDFMKRVRTSDYVLMIISDNYLKSKNCMYEVKEFIKDENFKERILPIVLRSANIFDTVKVLDYSKYWQEQYDMLSDKIKDINPINIQKTIEELKVIHEIGLYIDEFINTIKYMKVITIEELKKNNYREILNAISFENTHIIEKLIEIKRTRDYEKQDLLLEEILEEYPKHKEANFFRAYLESERGNNKKAKKYYQKLIRYYPEHWVGHNNLGTVLQKLNDPAGACKHYRKAIEINPNSSYAYFNLAQIEHKVYKKYDKAKEYYIKAIEIEPNNSDYYNNLGVLLTDNYFKDYLGAKECYLKAIQIDTKNSKAHNNLANILFIHFKDFEGAKIHYLKALELQPTNPGVHYNLAKLLAHQYFNDLEAAYKHFMIAQKQSKQKSRNLNEIQITYLND